MCLVHRRKLMKKVLAELHSLINDLEDQGLTAEASSLQDVFVRVAQEADEDMDDSDAEQEVEDDLANDVAGLLKSHSAAEVLAEIAKQMGGDSAGAGDEDGDSETSSFSFGDEPYSKPSILEIQDKHAKLAAEQAKQNPSAYGQIKNTNFNNALQELKDNGYDVRMLSPGAFGGAVEIFMDPAGHQARSKYFETHPTGD